jgi:RHS repeat-associated protein
VDRGCIGLEIALLSAQGHIENRDRCRDRSYGRVLYNRFRYYDPSLGRYISADPIGQAGGLNVYEYALLNPVSVVDPYGLQGGGPYGLGNGPYGQANTVDRNSGSPEVSHVGARTTFGAAGGAATGGPIGALRGALFGLGDGILDVMDFDGDGVPNHEDDSPYGPAVPSSPGQALPCDPALQSCLPEAAGPDGDSCDETREDT